MLNSPTRREHPQDVSSPRAPLSPRPELSTTAQPASPQTPHTVSEARDEVIFFRWPGDECNLIISNFPDELEAIDTLRSMFEPYGLLQELTVRPSEFPNERDGCCRVAYARYFSVEDAKKAKTALDGVLVQDRRLRVGCVAAFICLPVDNLFDYV